MVPDDVTLQDIIPLHWNEDVSVATFEDLVNLGRGNLEYVKDHWRRTKRKFDELEYVEQLISKAFSIMTSLDAFEDVPVMETPTDNAVDETKRKVESSIAIVEEAVAMAEEKPRFSLWRSTDWFAVDDEVIAFAADGNFKLAKVIDREENDLFVSIGEDVSVFWLGSPMLMKPWEYEYLKAHLDYKEIWAKASNCHDWAYTYVLATRI